MSILRSTLLVVLVASVTTWTGVVAGCEASGEPLVLEPTEEGPDPWVMDTPCLKEGEVCRIGDGGIVPGCCSGLMCGELNKCERD